MRIGELAQRSNCSRDTIRFYERNNLIDSLPSTNPSNNYRHYPEEAVMTLELIREAQAAGFTISELSVFISQLESSIGQDFDGEEFLQGKIADVEKNIERSTRFLHTLKASLKALKLN